jgi:glucose-6-phosphate 1-dehydrogenase
MENTDIEYLQKRVKKDLEEINRRQKQDANFSNAMKLHDMYQSLVDSGFTEEQAFFIFYEAVKAAWNAS